MRGFSLGARRIGPGAPCFVIAEAGVNHDGRLDQALRLVDAAVAAGADAVKFQTFSAAALVTPYAAKARYQRETTDPAESQFDMLARLELSRDMHDRLVEHCRSRITFLSTPFDEDSVDLLDSLGVTAFKVSSGELTNVALLRHLSGKKKPVLLSTGMGTLSDVELALEQFGEEVPVALLHCVSNYPTVPADANLRVIATLRRAFGVPVGFSDHTTGTAVALAAVARGASIIEKHLTLDRSLPGPDHRASLEPQEFRGLTASIRDVEAALGDGRKRPVAAERDVAAVARRSLVTACDVSKGTRLTVDMVTRRRPGAGLPPSALPFVIGRRAGHDLPAGHVLALDDFD
jgi:N-acetylneuraminate synthase